MATPVHTCFTQTLFHEFGHGLHGMLASSKYLRLAGVEGMEV